MNAFEKTVAAQQIAAHPGRSVFVMANAGAGKTHLLINRVARLLLTKIRPEKILCITFTKAAAAEMSERLFDVLGRWALLDDAALQKALDELEGVDAFPRAPEDLAVVRRLFAQALETPGGLKIQTIHAFCESTLRRFPLESGVAPGFTVLEDSDTRFLIDEALNSVAVDALMDEQLGAAFERLTAVRRERDLRALLIGAVQRNTETERNISHYGGFDGAIAALAAELGVDTDKSVDQIKSQFIAALPRAELTEAQSVLAASGKNAQKWCAAPLMNFLQSSDTQVQWRHLSKLFFKTNGEPRGKYGDKATEKLAPWVENFLCDLEEQFTRANETLKAASILADTSAYLTLQQRLAARFRSLKADRAALDFDDLIIGTQRLFDSAGAAWIMYKLDQGIDHILIDEAQDTSPGQWAVIEAPLKEFFGGEGARETNRTFFAVGDIKQSIYSFQGADAGLFAEKEHALGAQIKTVAEFKNVPLTLSFRTSPPVLSFVDALFADPEAAEGLGGYPIPPHDAIRTGSAGRVELWPLTPQPEKHAPDPWDAPVDTPPENHPVPVLCARIAATIKQWLEDGAILESKDRNIRPDDVLILVQSRGRLFDEVIRSLAREGVPVAGADRLKLMEDPAVEDLLAFARTVLTPADDLSLAETLKSPFFNFDDPLLFELAHPRPDGASLWSALGGRKTERDQWEKAHGAIETARRMADRAGPVAFFTHVLEDHKLSGRRALYARLGGAARDAVDELLRQALQFENAHPRSLRAFLRWFEDNAGEIKREMERESGAVRVMTVHGAKGLESNIVFLLDAQRSVNVGRLGPVFEIARDPAHADRIGKLPVLVGAKDRDVDITRRARDEKIRKEYEEYRRLLYVAATRARDCLYICGVEMGNDKNPTEKITTLKSWHSLAGDAFDRIKDKVETAPGAAWPNCSEAIRRIVGEQTSKPDEEETSLPRAPDTPPSWLHKKAPKEQAWRLASPSHLRDDSDETEPTPNVSAAYSPSNSQDRYFRGRTLHRLLELLPDVDAAKRPAVADKLLLRLAPQIDQPERDRWRDEVLAVLDDPAFAPVFAPGSRAEVSIAGTPAGGGPGAALSGQIDRLAIRDNTILVVDYKTNRPPPRRAEDADPGYIAQMAAYRALLQEIYPDHKIECALLWTYDARLMAIPPALMDHAFARDIAAG